MRRAERTIKKRLKFKKTQTAFRNNPYKAGKDLLETKCHTMLKVDQGTVDSFKSLSVGDNFYYRITHVLFFFIMHYILFTKKQEIEPKSVHHFGCQKWYIP